MLELPISTNNSTNKDFINRIRSKILKEYEKIQRSFVDESGLSVTTALDDSDIEKLVMQALEEAKVPISWRNLKALFQGIVGEDRLRRILNSLKARNTIAELTHTRYSLPKYVPDEELNKVKNPLAMKKIRESRENSIN
ncbi:MAG: hypothetical protein G5Z42_04560 [Caldisphaeraceae archaeon]|nr:hypothetical protein [Caldisphaeraceae archaeon]MEB3691687.1 hypothetical protein [Caldisphaeraceae archaeon]MEB3798077.1 hypothetical protein [Caldisphaeraceae archaeon]